MSADELQPPLTRREAEAFVRRLTQVILANTHTLRLLDAKAASLAGTIGEIRVLQSASRDSSSAVADRLSSKIDVLIEIARDARGDMRTALQRLDAVQDKLGLQRDKLAELAERDWTPSQPHALQAPEPEPEIISKRGLFIGWGVAWKAVKRAGPTLGWLSGAGTAIYHAIRHFFAH